MTKGKKNRVCTCEIGDIVIHNNREVWVNDIIYGGREKSKSRDGERSSISICTIMPDNGQVLRRSPRNIGTDWEHIPEDERAEKVEPEDEYKPIKRLSPAAAKMIGKIAVEEIGLKGFDPKLYGKLGVGIRNHLEKAGYFLVKKV